MVSWYRAMMMMISLRGESEGKQKKKKRVEEG
jgi:hypothetical protein